MTQAVHLFLCSLLYAYFSLWLNSLSMHYIVPFIYLFPNVMHHIFQLLEWPFMQLSVMMQNDDE